MNNNLIIISEKYDPPLVESHKLEIPIYDINTDGYDYVRNAVEIFTDGAVILSDEEIKELATDGLYATSNLRECDDPTIYLTELNYA